MRPQAQTEWKADPSFARLVLGRRVFVLHREILRHAAAIAAALREMGSSGAADGAGNRGGGRRLSLQGAPAMFARQSRRGGLARFLFTDIFFGISPRPLDELAIVAEANRRGVPVAEPMGAMVQWVAPGVYRGFFLSRAVAGMTLWEFLRTDDDPIVKKHVLMTARAAMVTMHDKGLFHADLNLHNLMVTQSGESFKVVILDFDKARIYDSSLRPALRSANARRLLRSARKLDPAGRYLDKSVLSILDVS
ncbi:MAG: lipopolysaccharide kinase InaA family protein [Candidatus Binataceae bacterium]